LTPKNLIITASGIRGIAKTVLNDDIVQKIAIAYGSWLKKKNTPVAIGRDTRISGERIERSIIKGLIATGCKVKNFGVCPTPIIIFEKNRQRIPGGIIISGSHNPPEWNGLKLLSSKTFLSLKEVNEISHRLTNIDLNKYNLDKISLSERVENQNPVPNYVQALYDHLDREQIIKKNNLKVVIDTGGGAGDKATPQILEGLGCTVKLINNELDAGNKFPRDQEPVAKNLKDLITTVRDGDYDIGFAHDCDADRLAIVGNDGTCYPEDIGLAVIADHYFKSYRNSNKKIIFVTNLASSLMFEAISKEYNAQVIRTPIGERYLAEKMDALIEEEEKISRDSIILGGEGSCGGVMFPKFNNARDGIFAAAKIVQILIETNRSISSLITRLPQFFSFRERIDIKTKNVEAIINSLKEELISQGEEVVQVGLDLKINKNDEWFVLIHPSNTEPIIRVISEGKVEPLTKSKCKEISDIIKSLI
jgi:phosphomannomutase